MVDSNSQLEDALSVLLTDNNADGCIFPSLVDVDVIRLEDVGLLKTYQGDGNG